MVKKIQLSEIVMDANTSKEKTRFLKLCKKRIVEAVDIWTGQSPNFDVELAQGGNPHELIIEGSRNYDAEIGTGTWCYIDFIATNQESKYRVNFHAYRDREFLLDYRGQKFMIHYGEIPKKRK